MTAKFSVKVWKYIKDHVGLGQTVSYGEVAVACGGSTNYSRAVGTAMKNNHVSLIIPCHRIIRHTGEHGNYSGGTMNSVKQWLIEHEQNF